MYFAEMVRTRNAELNLISRNDIPHIVERHILHSLSPLLFESFPEGYTIIDLGTGAGFPGIPLAIAMPHCRFILVDSSEKKAMFAARSIKELQLPNATAIHTRIEQLTEPIAQILLARALAPPQRILRWSAHLLSSQGYWILFKGEADREAIIQAGLSIVREHHIYSKIPLPYYRSKFLFICRRTKQ